jgi:glucose/sorbosone dehydrogenase
VEGGNENEALVYAYGFRNPFRFTIDPLTNDLFVGDVGENTYEEVSKVPYSAPGGNFGWPEFEGSLQDPVPGSTDCSTGPFTTALFTYVHAPTGGSSVICGPIVRPVAGGSGNFPPAYHGNLFVAEFYAGWIKRFVRSANGSSGWVIAPPAPGQEEFENWAVGLPFISDLQIGPDGALYFMNLVTGSLAQGLYRIVYTSTSDATDWGLVAASVFPNPMRVGSGLTIRLAPERLEAASLRVFDLAGRLVHESPARSGVAHWDGRTRSERPASAGIYLYRIETASGHRISGKITLIP